MNKSFVNIADKFFKQIKHIVYVKNDEYLSDSVKNDFVFNEISDSEIQNYINYIKSNYMNPNKSVCSDDTQYSFCKAQCRNNFFLSFQIV